MSRSRLFPLLGALLALLPAGCETMTTPERRIAADPATFDSLPGKHRGLVSQGRVSEGMSKDAVYLAWGRPHETRQGSRQGNATETWVYFGTETMPAPSFGFGYGYGFGPGYGYCGPGSYSSFSYDVAYRDYVAATVEFQRGKVVSWERNRR